MTDREIEDLIAADEIRCKSYPCAVCHRPGAITGAEVLQGIDTCPDCLRKMRS